MEYPKFSLGDVVDHKVASLTGVITRRYRDFDTGDFCYSIDTSERQILVASEVVLTTTPVPLDIEK